MARITTGAGAGVVVGANVDVVVDSTGAGPVKVCDDDESEGNRSSSFISVPKK